MMAREGDPKVTSGKTFIAADHRTPLSTVQSRASVTNTFLFVIMVGQLAADMSVSLMDGVREPHGRCRKLVLKAPYASKQARGGLRRYERNRNTTIVSATWGLKMRTKREYWTRRSSLGDRLSVVMRSK